ncbi:oxygen-evolving enhancer protein 3, chloroplastic-like [Cornus florida]|uniref:oxygen-evolving enhancer protein 3, chloroplastic-like n=1 Tax=Cornus florida TaxID=4283 RepID=UPI00289C3563|nr:oxygen-evolving enhancer protein 3, chloroplastic-like [Cornus florida]XP_059649844.1 oxygen-evolving enhancer protein 3, chloroplastic-like [Cornus florida]XP_059649845.1 oxygen-evolving enhancer protein 3, chloroplastic-like [Cornus florida]
MVDVVGLKGSACRIRKCAFDLLSIGGDLVVMDDNGSGSGSSWDLMGRDLRLKSTLLYCDFNHIISASPHQHHKNTLTQLANKLFRSIEELDDAVKIRSVSLSHDRYNEAAVILHEVMAFMSSDVACDAQPSPSPSASAAV